MRGRGAAFMLEATDVALLTASIATDHTDGFDARAMSAHARGSGADAGQDGGEVVAVDVSRCTRQALTE